MAKKKKKPQNDDLIDQLLEDVKGVAGDDNIFDQDLDVDAKTAGGSPLPPPVGENEKPVGLDPEAAKVDSTHVRGENLWESMEENLAPPPKEDSNLFEEVKIDSIPDDSEFRGPSLDGGYQSIDDINNGDMPPEATRPISVGGGEDRTVSLARSNDTSHSVNEHESTVAADGFALRRDNRSAPSEKVAIGSLRGARTGNVFTSMDASLAQAENLKIAQARILELEKENDRLRQENDEVSSAADIIRSRLEELTARITSLEREKTDVQESLQNEIMILKGNLQYKESEVAKARLKIDELETRLRSDFKKIRVKERELENRLELARAEKAALVRAKDENILELKRKTDQQQAEIDNYREKLLELNKTIDSNQEQFKRTVRALRLALANLEVKDENVVPIKKAE